MLAFMALRGKRLIGSMQEMRRFLLLGVLMLFFGNVGLVWAEYYLPSGLAALLVAIIPVYVAVIEWMMPHGERLRMRGQIGLVMGFIGLAIFAFPSARTGLRGDWHEFVAIVVLLLGALSFSIGSVWSRGTRFSLDPFVCAGWEMLAASFCDVVVATVMAVETRNLEPGQRFRHRIPGGVRFAGRLLILHLAAEKCSSFQSGHLRLCQPHGGRTVGRLGAGRTIARI